MYDKELVLTMLKQIEGSYSRLQDMRHEFKPLLNCIRKIIIEFENKY